MSTKTPVEILTEAKRILMEGTWSKALGGVTAPIDGHCALTAVAAAEYKVGGFGPLKEVGGASVYLGRAAMGRGYLGAHLFNDDPKTTFSDVMALYDDAILLAKEEEARV